MSAVFFPREISSFGVQQEFPSDSLLNEIRAIKQIAKERFKQPIDTEKNYPLMRACSVCWDNIEDIATQPNSYNYSFFVFRNLEGRIEGMCVTVLLKLNTTLMIHILVTHPKNLCPMFGEVAMKGVGSSLLKYVENGAVAARCLEIQLKSTACAIDFYLRQGFKQIREGSFRLRKKLIPEAPNKLILKSNYNNAYETSNNNLNR